MFPAYFSVFRKRPWNSEPLPLGPGVLWAPTFGSPFPEHHGRLEDKTHSAHSHPRSCDTVTFESARETQAWHEGTTELHGPGNTNLKRTTRRFGAYPSGRTNRPHVVGEHCGLLKPTSATALTRASRQTSASTVVAAPPRKGVPVLLAVAVMTSDGSKPGSTAVSLTTRSNYSGCD